MARGRRSAPGLIAALVLIGGLSGACQGSSGDEPPDPAVQKVELGRHLFYERRLSVEGNRSCGICHEPALGFTDGFVRAVGSTDEVHHRNTLTLTNVGRREALTWGAGAPDSLEEQLLIQAQTLTTVVVLEVKVLMEVVQIQEQVVLVVQAVVEALVLLVKLVLN